MPEVSFPVAVRVEIESESAVSEKPARARVYVGASDTLVADITGSVALMRGADGELYPCVELKNNLPQS